MFRIGKAFHLLHVVADLDAVDAWYDDVFAVRRFVRNKMKPAMRKASLVLIGDFVMEPAQPLQYMSGWEKSALGRFYSRYGPHFHSMAWYVDDLAETCARLTERGIRLFDMVGHTVTQASPKDGAIWTHPQDTHAAFEFAAVPKFFIDPRLQPGWSDAFARDEHPLGIERASHLTMLFRDLGDARKVYEQALGCEPIHEQETAGRRRSVFYAVGADTIVEAAQPLSPTSPEGADLARAGEGIHAVTFRTKNLQRAADHLRSKGLHLMDDGDAIVIDPKDAFGTVLRFTEGSIPNDPR
ncbi:MAG TPA: VOC family protein [Candidatus Binataceae bacterium]|nr:VOC family protein [Candidatus Binataceae bacterium]